MSLHERFKELVDQEIQKTDKKTLDVLHDVSNGTEIPFETIRNLYYRKDGDPKTSTTEKLANYYNLSMNCMIGKCNHTKEEKELLLNYRSCGRHGKSIIELIAKYESGAVKSEREGIDKHTIPCLFPRGEIRKGIVYDLCETKDIEVCVKDAFIAIQMTDNDLAPIYCKGDIILFEDRFPENGEIAAFFKKDRAYIRKFIEEEGKYILKSLYHKEDIILKRMDDIEYIGTCIDVIRA